MSKHKKKTISIWAAILLLAGVFIAQTIFGVFYSSIQEAQADGESWETGYTYRKKITIDNTKVSGSSNLENFPVLINTTDNDLRTTGDGGKVENANGYDIMFTSSDGATDLDHEIEKYTSAAGSATYIAWVRIPALSYNADTVIYMYYGNDSVSSDPSKTSTWNANYKMVQHLEETSGTHYDSTSNDNDGTNSGSTQDATGKINGANDFDGDDDYVSVGNLSSISAITLEAWIQTDLAANDSSKALNRLFVGRGSDSTIVGGYSNTKDKFSFNQRSDATWTPIGGLAGALYAMSLLESSDGTLYAGTGHNGDVFKSTDDGTNWTNTGDLAGAGYVQSLLEASDGTLYAGAAGNGDVFESIDGGDTWTNTGNLSSATHVLSLLEASDGTLYAGTGNANGDVFKSIDGGTNWTNTGNLASATIVNSLLEASDGTTLYAGTEPNGDVFKSINGGTSWTNTGDLASATIVNSLLEASDGTLYAGTWTSGDVFKSTDGGDTWTNTGDLALAEQVRSLLEASDGTLYAGAETYPNGNIFKSTNSGTSWTNTGGVDNSVNSLLETSDGTLYAATGNAGRVFKVDTNVLNSTSQTFSADDWLHLAFVFSGSSQKIYINGSEDAGNSNNFSSITISQLLLGGDKFNQEGDGGFKVGTRATSFDGTIDEVRISATDRSAGWLTTGYNNQKYPDKDDHPTPPNDGFYTVGSQETGNTAPTAPTLLECEGETDPTSVADTTPEFTAIGNDPDSGDTLTHAYIQVGTTEGGSDMWDSSAWIDIADFTEGTRCQEISYAGSALSLDGSTYYWRIKFKDDEGVEGVWSSTQFTVSDSFANEDYVADKSNTVVTGGQVKLDNYLSMPYRKKIPLTGAGTAGTNYQKEITVGYSSGGDLDCESHCQTDFDDIRFVDADDTTELDYWRETYTESSTATFWVEVKDSLSSGNDPDIYMYYGHNTADTASDGDATFLFFDDFPGESVDTNKWTVDEPDQFVVSGGKVRCTGTVSYPSLESKTFTTNPSEGREVRSSLDVQSLASNDGLTQYVTWLLGNGLGWYAEGDHDRYVCFSSSCGFQAGVNKGITTGAIEHSVRFLSGSINHYATGARTIDDTFTGTVEDTERKLNIFNTHKGYYEESEAVIDLYWIFVRKYSSSEPGFGTIGSEIASQYYSSGTLTSTNLLDGKTVGSIDSFDYNVSAKPTDTELKVQFSQNGTTWCDSSNDCTGSAYDILSSGSHNISLSTLDWSGGNFYYKATFESNPAQDATPLLDSITVNYSDYAPSYFTMASNQAPTIDSVSTTKPIYKSGKDGTPTDDPVIFTSVASDPGDTIKLYVCKNSLCANCEPGDISKCWAVSTDEQASSSDPQATYTSSACDYNTYNYWAKVCDSSDLCSSVKGE